MRKYSMFLVLAMLVVGLISTSASAGTVTPNSAAGATVLQTIALEAMGAARNTSLTGANNYAISFTSTRSLISGDMINFTFTNAGSTNQNIYLCDVGTNAYIDVVQPSANALTFTLRSNRSITAGTRMFLSTSSLSTGSGVSCQTAAIGIFELRYQPVTSAALAGVSFTVTNGSSTLDTADAVNFANITREYSTGYTSNNSSIDYLSAPSNGSKFASNNARTVSGSSAAITTILVNYDAVTNAGLTVSALLSLQDSASWQGVKSVYLRANGLTCDSTGTNVVANNSPSGTVNMSIPAANFAGANAAVTNALGICAEVNGNATIQARTIKAAIDISVSGTGNNDPALDTYTTVMSWMPNGYQGIVPYISTSSTYGTICFINNTSASSVPVSVEILSSESGATLTSLATVSGGTVAAKGTNRIDFDSSVTPYSWISGVETAGTPVALTGLNAADRYSAKVSVGASSQDVTVNCIQKDPAGSKRAVPVLQQYSTTVWQN